MNEIIKRLQELDRHKERVKHDRGGHDQRKHTRLDYLAGGLIGDGGTGGRRDTFQNSRMSGGMPSVSSAISNAANYSLANRKRPTTGGTATASGAYVGARPTRQAAYGLQGGRQMRAGAFRSQAAKMGQEYRRRHRMMSATAPSQGVVSPNAMKAKPFGTFFEPDNPQANLFENPSLIEGRDPRNPDQRTNMDDYVLGGLDESIDQLQTALEEAGVPSEKASQYMDRLASIYATQYEGHMRKAAATFAMDIQGFVGGEIYSNDDLEFTAARAMAVEANRQMQMNQILSQALWEDIQDEHPDAYDSLLKASKKDSSAAMAGYTMEQADSVIAGWSAANPAPVEMAISRDDQGDLVPGEKPVNTRQLARINPALATDIAGRMWSEGTRGGGSASDTRQSLTMSLDSLWGTLSPKIQAQLSRLIKAKVKQPQTDDASLAFEDRQTASLGVENQKATNAFKGVLQSLHTDGGIADVRVAEASLGPRVSGMYTPSSESMTRYGVQDTSAPHIIMNADAIAIPEGDDPVAHRVSVMAHEFGHLIDSTAMTFGEAEWRDGVTLSDVIGNHGGLPGNTWQSKSPMVAPMLRILNRWMEGPYRRTTEALESRSIDPATRGSARQALIYLSQPHEVFARLYQQWVNTEMIKRLDAGEKIDGVDDSKATRDTLERMNTGMTASGLAQRFFEPDDYDEAVKDLQEIFSAMGWKLK